MIQAALNGGRTRAEHPAVPQTPAEIAVEAAAAVAAGAGSLHVHVRGADGRESLAAMDVAAALAAVRESCPGVPVGISTGAWIVRDPRLRLALVADWQVLPDYVSVNFHEEGAAALAAHFLDRGVGVEAGIGPLAGAHALAASGLAPRCLRLLLEPSEPAMAEALAVVAAAEEIADATGAVLPRLLHGVGSTAWPMIAEAARRGFDTRIGLEDVLVLPDGTLAPGNAALVLTAVALMAGAA